MLSGPEHVMTYPSGKIRACTCLVGHDHPSSAYEWRPGVLGLIGMSVALICVLLLATGVIR